MAPGADPQRRSGRRAAPWLEAASEAVRRRFEAEWFASSPHIVALGRPRVDGFSAFPKDFRPASAENGRAMLRGDFILAAERLDVGVGGDPFDRPSPSRAFAVELHGFGWLPHLIAAGEEGVREALRLIGLWRKLFGRWNSFAWTGEPLERRCFNLACATGALTASASEAEVESLANLLARHVRQLLAASDPAWRGAERSAAAAVAAAALSGKAAERLYRRARRDLEHEIRRTVLPDGGHASRSPEAGLELLFDLRTLDEALEQKGGQPLPAAFQAVDRLTSALRFFTLADGRLACFQGGEECDPGRIAAARAHEGVQEPSALTQLPHAGYQRLAARSLQLMVDCGPPAPDPFSAVACAQTGAVEILCNGERLVTNAGWSPRLFGAQALRLTDAASTVSIGHESAGEPLRGWRARALGPRLLGGAHKVEVNRQALPDQGLWLELSHDGWLERFGLTHARRLFLDLTRDELRGEDQFTPARAAEPKVIPYVAHFHLAPEVGAVVARDQKSVLLRGPSSKGWWLRNDATDVRVEPAVHFQGGRQTSTTQVVLTGHIRADKGGRVRWKLTPVEG